MTIAQAIQWAKQQLTAHNVSDDGMTNSVVIDSRVLLCACLDCELTYLHTWPEKALTPGQKARFEDFISQRVVGHPVAYIIGYRDFWSLRLNVSPATLIPRSETELLVELALELALPESSRVLDLGTGTGAIALSLASENPNWHVLGVDKSHAAVELAKENAKLNGLEQVKFSQSDWFSAIDGQKYDLIVTNPPYVESSSPFLHRGDVRFEPASALTSGLEGMDDIQVIAQQAKNHMSPNAWLVIEHGYQQAQIVKDVLNFNGYSSVINKLDLNHMPRVTLAQKS
ncbi:peptide chain release factor N(5)-glutamine methyltransferase [Paraglaciecola sp.]|uniref:peptide chain release factor N(5)-glutamine methyltransferase n=1 Tax=Paraglaciecola sp. TaxID=1920173 RepID=UPI003EF7B149